MTNSEKVNELTTLVEEYSKYNGNIQWPYVVGWLVGVLKKILDGNTTIDIELERIRNLVK
jgi:hypothetical protein